MPRKNKITNSASTAYYLTRVAQRISLLTAAATAIVLWMTLIAISVDSRHLSANHDPDMIDIEQLGILNDPIVESLTVYAIQASVVAVVITVTLLYFPRVKKYEKRLVVDGLAIASFCLLATVFAQATIRAFLSSLV